MDILATVASLTTISSITTTKTMGKVEDDKASGSTSTSVVVAQTYGSIPCSAVDSNDDDEDPLKDFQPLTNTLVYAMSEEHEIEVMPERDVTKVRVQLKESFSGIPLPLTSKTKQKKIDKAHAHYKLAVGMMTGIREAVGGMDGLLEADFDEQDFHAKELLKECRRNRKYSFYANASHNDAYEFKAYAPLVFARLRSHVGIDKNLFLHSVCGNFQYLEFMSNAKSGSFFFFSHDARYLIKTLTIEECHFLVKILPPYYHYIVNNPDSFLTRFYGLYRLQTTEQTIYFSIMKSVLDTPHPMSHTYDLKGSTLGREAKANETVKKDLDILKEGRKLGLPPSTQDGVMRQLTRDATLLARLGIMDYSFLLGIYERPDDDALDNTSNDREGDLDTSKDHDHDDETEKFEMKPEHEETHLHSEQPQQHYIVDEELRKLGGGRPPHQEDEYVDWETVDLVPCFDNCSVSTSFSDSVFGPSNPPSLWHGSIMEDAPCPLPIREDGGIESSDKKCIYYAGIIDILQPYNTLKWGETVVKKVQGNSEQEISCVDPETYGNRFVKFLSRLVKA
jgi:1-phosphatidylinositol-4-phosphate 5-kinase